MAKGNKKSDLQNLPACAVEFIRLVINKMRYRREIRQDVQAELATHFEDELKACTSDKEREQKAQQLIAGFGDVKLLAVLLRRAKKRCRPLWQTVVARTFQTIGVLIVCFVIYIVWFFTGRPVITTDYVAELNRIVRPIADETQNAAPLYLKAAELYEKVPEDISKLFGKKYREAAAEEKQLIEKWLRENSEALELVIAGTGKPYCWQKYEGEEMISILMPHLAEFRKIAFSLRWRAQLRAEQGQYQAAFDDAKTCYRFGQHIRGDKTLVEQLVGIAIEAMAIQALRDILSEHAMDSAKLAVLQKDFEQMVAGEDFIVSFEVEKMFLYDEIQRCFTEDRFGGGHISFDGIRRIGALAGEGFDDYDVLAGAFHILFTHPNRQETLKQVEKFYDFVEKMAGKTPAQIRAENIDFEKQSMEIIKGNILLEILAPALGRVCEIAHRNKADSETALAIIAILRYEQNSGGYPQNLKQLIADDYLKKPPIDPYSDEPLVYRRTDDGFTLYSVGPNFIDDGGKIFYNDRGRPVWRGTKEGGDAVFWPVAKPQVKQ